MINQIIEKLTANNCIFGRNYQLFLDRPTDNYYFHIVRGGIDFAYGSDVITDEEYHAISNHIAELHYHPPAPSATKLNKIAQDKKRLQTNPLVL